MVLREQAEAAGATLLAVVASLESEPSSSRSCESGSGRRCRRRPPFPTHAYLHTRRQELRAVLLAGDKLKQAMIWWACQRSFD